MLITDMAKKIKRLGRPTISGVTRGKTFRLRMTQQEYDQLEAIAAKRDISMAELLMEPYRKG